MAAAQPSSILVTRGLSARARAPRSSVVTIGTFDGVHLGHQQVLGALRQVAAQHALTPIVASFYPHPSVALGRAPVMPTITSFHQKVALLRQHGVEQLALYRFSSALYTLSAREFLHRYIVGHLGAHTVILGPDTAVGKGREAQGEQIATILAEWGVKTEQVQFQLSATGRISSREIRSAVSTGEMASVIPLLGRPYTIRSVVVHGDKRGRTIGFPTANLAPTKQMMPQGGVYLCRCIVDGVSHLAVSNVGTRPTVNGHGVRVECHLLDFDQDLYGHWITVEFLERLRGEQKFPSLQALQQQIQRDVASARMKAVSV